MEIRKAHRLFIGECRRGVIKRRSETTIKNYKNSLSLLLKMLPQLTSVRHITKENMRQFLMIGDDERKWSVDTHISHRKNLRPFTEWCIAKRYLSKDPFDEIPYPPQPRRLPKLYSDEQAEKLAFITDKYADDDFLRKRNNAILGMFLMTGVRKGELLGMRVLDIDFDTGFLKVKYKNAKNRADRVIPIMPELSELLKKYIKARDDKGIELPWLWASSHKKRFTASGWKHLCEQLSEKAGFEVGAHKLRHTFASNFVRDGGDIYELQRILGHRDVQTSMIYLHVYPEDLRASMAGNRLNNLF